MCAIIGSSNLETFKHLIRKNRDRGKFASSIVSIGSDVDIFKMKGSVKESDFLKVKDSQEYYVGHVQAPTSSLRHWRYETSHPFVENNWIVFHNGVLTNHTELYDNIEVDTQAIAKLLSDGERKTLDVDEVIIKKTLNKIRGTFSLFMINKKLKSMYIARQGSILHFNDNGDISSLQDNNMSVIPEGIIYRYDNGLWNNVEVFETKSPFLFI